MRSKAFEGSLTAIGFGAIFVFFSIWLGSKFTNIDALLLDIHGNAPELVLGLAVLVTLVSGQFDLSAGAMATLTAFLAVGLCINQHWPFALVVAVCLAVGVGGGLINGFLVEIVGVNAFIATLGTGSVFDGISYVYGKGTEIVPEPGGRALPHWFTNMGSFTDKAPSWLFVIAAVLAALGAISSLRRMQPARLDDRTWLATRVGIIAVVALILVFVFHLPAWFSNASWLVAALFIAAAVIFVMLRFTTFGRYLFAAGSNRDAARLAGVRVQREVIKAFMIGGFLAAVSGVLVAATTGSASPGAADTFLLPAFAAAFLSTVVFSTGRFTVVGTIIGGVFVVWVAQGLIIGGLPPTWTDVVNGLILVAAVALSTFMRRRR